MSEFKVAQALYADMADDEPMVRALLIDHARREAERRGVDLVEESLRSPITIRPAVDHFPWPEPSEVRAFAEMTVQTD